MRSTIEHLPGLTLTCVTLDAALDHADPSAGTIEVFARVVTADGGESLPYLVFLQGGPGHEAGRPTPTNPPWLARALKDFQVVLLDQRGTGRSTPVSSPTLPPLAGLSATEQASFLTHLRADEIVNDCELFREFLGAKQWTVLGQSFGGFTTLHYLSTHAESLAGAIITGGLSAVRRPIDDVYALTWQIMSAKSETYYRRFPGDRDRVRALTELCAAGQVILPNGDVVSPARFRTVGSNLGVQGGPELLHYLLELDHRSSGFAHDLAHALPFSGRNPLYAVLHESSYADGVATRWSAERTMPERVREDVTLLGGEHIHRSVFAEDTELKPFAEVADLLAEHEWNQLYFPDRLAQADLPVAASVYYEDAFVPREFSMETAALLPDCRPWVTSEYEHNGLRADEAVLDHLIGLLKGTRWL
ncbi:MAG TPA: alpha/beta fold hydrolase [Propionicimonas sp.]|jgi:pimeloyl-ACP methyl ester carboxylesterase|uniref:alpha/beta fold hydrolase n=1 Tax=Propionicimonas sp. TaxID=1955623 RepID=UPI002F4071D0